MAIRSMIGSPAGRSASWISIALLCGLLCAFGLWPDPVEAVSQFGSRGSLAGEFIEPNGIAVDQYNGDVLIVDSNNGRVEKFTQDGIFLLAWGWGVADGKAHALQTCNTRCFAGSEGASAGQLGFAEGVAMDNDPTSPSYGDVYVVDIGNHRVEKFTTAGKFLLMFGGEVNVTAHEYGDRANEGVCPVNPGDRCRAGTKGPGEGQFEFAVEGSFIAVGPDGTVYVGDRNRVQQFSPAGIYHAQVRLLPEPKATGSGEVGGTSGLAVNAAGDLYVIRNGIVGVDEYEPSGRLLRTLDEQGEPAYPEGPTPTIALDSAGDVFIDDEANEQHRIDEYDSLGVKLASFDAGMERGLHGIAFGDRVGELYVVDTNNNVTPIVARVRVVRPPDPGPFAPMGSELARWLVPQL
jgi:tripartite motif-containing protein 71